MSRARPMSTFQKFEDPTADARSQFGTLSAGAGAVEAGGEMAESLCAYCASQPTSTQSRNGNGSGTCTGNCSGNCSGNVNVPGVGVGGKSTQKSSSATGTMRRAPHGASASVAGSASGEGTPSPKRCWVLVAGWQTASIV